MLFIFTNQTPKLQEGDTHSPNPWRVNVVLSNMPQFAADFRCAPGAKLNPPEEERCAVWWWKDSLEFGQCCFSVVILNISILLTIVKFGGTGDIKYIISQGSLNSFLCLVRRPSKTFTDAVSQLNRLTLIAWRMGSVIKMSIILMTPSTELVGWSSMILLNSPKAWESTLYPKVCQLFSEIKGIMANQLTTYRPKVYTKIRLCVFMFVSFFVCFVYKYSSRNRGKISKAIICI